MNIEIIQNLNSAIWLLKELEQTKYELEALKRYDIMSITLGCQYNNECVQDIIINDKEMSDASKKTIIAYCENQILDIEAKLQQEINNITLNNQHTGNDY